ncbi:MAG: branched-chain amino acid ABC transporter permease [Alphaproteobacteria bacterium]|nr:branched-chain amino acid ABC transporter permease [Alphaproteobacteria bacterium]
MNVPMILKGVGLLAVLIFPALGFSDYVLHIAISILIWGFIYTGWSIMGRFGLVSLGHGAFMGIGAYVVTMLWNHAGITPWIGIPVAVVVSGAVAIFIGFPCFRFRITGHYFALVTLALSEVVRLLIVALRDTTGGSLGVTPRSELTPEVAVSFYAMQFADKTVWFYLIVVIWLGGLLIWRAVDRSMLRYAMEAISQEDDAAASLGVHVTRAKLTVTVISAAMTAVGGAVYGQYQLYINPETTSGIAISLQIVFAVIAGGMFVQLGPTMGAVITLLLTETLRQTVGHDVYGLDVMVYGAMLVLFIIYMPRGVLGWITEVWSRRQEPRPTGTVKPQPGE